MARAREARVSMMRLTQSIWIGLSGDYLSTAAPANARIRAQQFTVSWNCRNLRIESKMLRPHFIAVTMEAKLSSSRMMPEAYLATSVPAIPIAKPISAFLSAGASLVPSPVMATTWWSCLRPVAIMYLSVGDERASTFSWSRTSLKF